MMRQLIWIVWDVALKVLIQALIGLYRKIIPSTQNTVKYKKLINGAWQSVIDPMNFSSSNYMSFMIVLIQS